jgi:hypothetical protein
MIIYFLLLLILLHWSNYNKNSIRYDILIFFILFFVTIFRSIKVGTDYANYRLSYSLYKKVDFFDTFKISFIKYFSNQVQNHLIISFEPLYSLFVNLSKKVGFSFFQFNILITLFYLILVFLLFKNISKNWRFNIFLFYVLFYYFMFLNTSRQALAIPFVFLSLKYFEKKNILKSLFFIFTAIGFHFNTIFVFSTFIILRFIYNFKYSKYFYLFFVFFTLINIFNLNYVLQYFLKYNSNFLFFLERSNNSKYLLYNFLYQLQINMIFVFTIIFFNNENKNHYVFLWFFGIIFFNLFSFLPEVHRFSDYFLFFSIFVISNVFENISPKKKLFLYFIIFTSFTYNLFLNRQGVVPFSFI